mmetsp:Transcript_46638/g.105155  ORF Transcript_46638/g.105155 Transcript_46638/m.105155 type:complete len:210 (+) Transcript_46638:87-716(+)
MLLAGSTAEPTIRYTRRSVWLRVTLYPWTRVLTSDSSLHSRDCCTDERCAQEQRVSDCCRRTRHGGGTCRSATLAHKNQIREPTLRPAAPYCLAPSCLGVPSPRTATTPHRVGDTHRPSRSGSTEHWGSRAGRGFGNHVQLTTCARHLVLPPTSSTGSSSCHRILLGPGQERARDNSGLKPPTGLMTRLTRAGPRASSLHQSPPNTRDA